ncbi:MAG: hypothetical protein ABW124_18660 [Candidatus Thiodiazotropha sp. 6PLUC9]
MRKWTTVLLVNLALILIFVPQLQATGITDSDSTQPRGAPANINNLGQDISPLKDGIMSSHQRSEYIYPIWDDHYSWSGMMMANSMRDPSFMAMLNVVNKTFIRYVNAHKGDPSDPNSEVAQLLETLGLTGVVTTRDANGRLQPENQIPVVADLCLRCHTPPGWLEGHSEPANDKAPFLSGQFWGTEFTSYPGDPNDPHLWDPGLGSESEIDGIQCDVCHRMKDNYKVQSNYDGSWLPAGNAGYILQQEDILDHTVEGIFLHNPNHDFVKSAELCGTCHNVTNPIFKTKTEINGTVPDVLHPVERTYTEWYWSDFGPNGPEERQTTCQGCHEPMKFLGAQTWLIDPGLGDLWGNMDQLWTQAPFLYDLPPNRISPVLDPDCGDAADPACWLPGAYPAAADRNREFMKRAATIEIIETPSIAEGRDGITAKVRVTNHTGHKLPTGYPEGRRMWIDIKAVDQSSGKTVFHSGKFRKGKIIKPKKAKIYEMISVADGYDDLMFEGFNILDLNKNGRVSHKEKEFHFILGNKVEKDNRIPPAGFNKDAYMADAAFIVPRDELDNDYTSGQNWDDTTYEIDLPRWVKGPLEITATLRYQTFSKEFVKFLKKEDKEKTQEHGGRARNIPKTGKYGHYKKWGKVTHDIWKKNDHGQPVEMATTSHIVNVNTCDPMATQNTVEAQGMETTVVQ